MLDFQVTLQGRMIARRDMDSSGFTKMIEEISIALQEYQDDEDIEIRRLVDDWFDQVDAYQ